MKQNILIYRTETSRFLFFSVSFYDDNGKLAETKLLKEEAVGPGYSVMLVDYPEIQRIRTEVEYSAVKSENRDGATLSDLKIDTDAGEDIIVISIANTDDKPIEYPLILGLLFRDGHVAEYINDDMNMEKTELKSGETITIEHEILSEYDDYRVYVSSR